MNVGLMLEGTYPYVTGGVSGWVHCLIRAMPDVRFTIFALVAEPKAAAVRRYPALPNVERVINVPLYGVPLRRTAHRHASRADWQRMARFHEEFKTGRFDGLPEIMDMIGAPRNRRIDAYQAIHSPESFETLCSMYHRYVPEGISFLDYFWTWRSIHLPIFRVMEAEIPPCDVYHSLCTGFAGLMASVARRRHRRPFLLTEHGVYSSERRDELWELLFRDGRAAGLWDLQTRRFMNGWWDRLFSTLSRMAYAEADAITTIANCGRDLQIQEGADPAKIEVVWAGIDVDRVRAMRRAREAPDGRLAVALVGRVVPVKDVKNFLQMGAILVKHVPHARMLVVGPADHDDNYGRECRELSRALGLDGQVQFTGEVDVAKIYGETDVVVLSSLREVVPRVLMEANGCGIPVVATDVGACREMLEGRSPEDAALGPSGLVVPLGSPGELARAVMSIGTDRERWRAMSRAGIERTERYYDEQEGWRRYARIYEELAQRTPAMDARGTRT